jgi:hypothetical protein
MCQFILFPRTLIYGIFFLTLVRIYVCAFMAMSVYVSPPLDISLTDAITSL